MSKQIGKWKQKVNDFYKDMTREEFIKHLQDAGFEVKDGTDRVVDEDGNDITDEILRD